MTNDIGVLTNAAGGERFAGSGTRFTSIVGFRIDTLPIVSQDNEQERPRGRRAPVFTQQTNLKQWRDFVTALHEMALRETSVSMSFAIQFTATPRPNFGAKVEIHFLVRVSAPTAEGAELRAAEVAASITQLFPKGDILITVVAPTPLTEDELSDALFHHEKDVRLVGLSKFVEHPASLFDSLFGQQQTPADAHEQVNVSFTHPIFSESDAPLLGLMDVLEQASEKVCVRCEIEPTRLTDDEEEFVSLLSQRFETTALDGERQYDLLADHATREQLNRGGERRATKGSYDTFVDARTRRAARLSPRQMKAARRGHYAYQSLYEGQARLFTVTVSFACAGGKAVSDAVTASVLGAVSAADGQHAAFGWRTPELSEPEEAKRAASVQNFRWMTPLDTQPDAARLRWKSFFTTRETLTFFHLPAMNGPAVGVETTSVPFYVTAEFLKNAGLTTKNRHPVPLGYVYHSNVCHDPQTVGIERALPFNVSLRSLTKPTLISGAPGGGKTNWVFGLLINMFREYGVPWCVIDPSSGQEYRLLLAEESLKDHMVVYTVADNLTAPLRFNPFALAPSGHGGSNTVRSHVAKLISCFKAASDMWTPLPEIFQEALCRAYRNFDWTMDDTHETGKALGLRFPSFTDFARALDEELDENIIPNYGHGTEAAGVLLGGTRDRVNSIINQLGHILDVADDSTDFFQNLLRTPCVLELGSLGTEDAIALVMSFLLVQIAGHTEYAYRAGLRKGRQHLLCVEEAHILLSNEGSTKSNAMQQGNPRGKAAEDFGRMLLEFRKFGSGVVLIDQRIASLIGSAVDSAYLNLMFQTVAPASFDHLKTILNLDPQQIEYAHTRLDEGRCILMDRTSGRPMLIRQKNILDELKTRQLTFAEFVERTKRNAQQAALFTPAPANDKRPKRQATSKRVFQPRDGDLPAN